MQQTSASPDETTTVHSPKARMAAKWTVRLLVLVAVVWGIGHFVREAQTELAEKEFDWRKVKISWLVIACLCYAVGLLPACWFWQRILLALGQRPKFFRTARAYYFGHLGKYVPGKALVEIMRTALIRGPGVDTTVAAVSVFIETLTMMAVGAFISAVILVFQFPEWRLIVLALGLMCAAGIPTWPPLFRWFVRKLRVKRANPAIESALEGVDAGLMMHGWLSLTVGWVLLGLSLFAVMEAIPQVTIGWQEMCGDIPLFTACVALAMVAGFLSLLPGGVGVRELVVMALIAAHPQYGPLVAIVSAVLLRLCWLMSELVVSGILYATCRAEGNADLRDTAE